jgi:hypothetical protein
MKYTYSILECLPSSTVAWILHVALAVVYS